MPLYMDVHKLDGATAEDVVVAHLKDLEVQDKYGVKYVTYWFNEAAGKVFCLSEAPNLYAAVAVHREAHGLIPDEIIEVEPGSVERFMGKVSETSAAKEPAKPATESAFRAVMFTDMVGSTALTQRLGDDGMLELLRIHDTIVRDALKAHNGHEVKHTGDGIMACFEFVSRVVKCSVVIQTALDLHNKENAYAQLRVRIGLSAGEPVEEHRDLYGATIQMAARICALAEPCGILVSNVIRELSIGKMVEFTDQGEAELRGFKEPVRLHEVKWQE